MAAQSVCDCCAKPISDQQLRLSREHPYEAPSRIVILHGHERHWYTPPQDATPATTLPA